MFWLLEARMWWGVPLTCPPRWKLHHESPRIGPGTQEEPGEGQSARSPSGVSSLIPPPQPYPPRSEAGDDASLPLSASPYYCKPWD